jgi:DNA-binding response OmpR family regulator
MNKSKILIVDDEQDQLSILDMTLTKSGFSVTTADNGKDGLLLAGTHFPDLIILDLSMPDMDGTDVAQMLKMHESTKDIPILFLTGLYDKQQEEKKGHKVGQNTVIAKPFEPKKLIAMITKLLSNKPSPV